MDFLLPGVGVLIAKLLTGKFDLRGTKIPITHKESFCPQCNKPCQPVSEQCFSCGVLLTPKVESEVYRELA